MGMYNDGCESTVIMVRQQQKQKDPFELRRYFRNEIINAKTGPNNNKQQKKMKCPKMLMVETWVIIMIITLLWHNLCLYVTTV